MSYYPQKLQDWVGAQSSSVPVGANFQYSVTNTALSPDGLPNYGLRSVPKYVAGVSTPDSIINVNDTRLLARGFGAQFLDPHFTDGRVQDWNLTIEKEIMANTLVRVAYVGNYGDKQQQWVDYNDSTPDYIWYATKKNPCRPANSLPWPGGLMISRRTGTSTCSPRADTAVTTAFSSSWSDGSTRVLRSSSSGCRKYGWINRDTDDTRSRCGPGIQHISSGRGSTDLDARNRFLNYKRDPNTPKHQIRWNFIVDLPFGRGKKFARQLPRGVVEQDHRRLAGCRTGEHQDQLLDAADQHLSARANRSKIYGYKYPIQDCTERHLLSPAICGGTATFPPTGSTAWMPTASRTASWAFRRTTSPRPRL